MQREGDNYSLFPQGGIKLRLLQTVEGSLRNPTDPNENNEEIRIALCLYAVQFMPSVSDRQ